MKQTIERPTMCGSERSFADLHQIVVPRLSTAEQFVVGVARCWDAFLIDPDPTLPWRELAPVFAFMNVMGALCAFDTAFHVLSAHRTRAFEFHEVDSLSVGMAEARLLCGLSALQRANPRLARSALHGALPRSGVHALLPPLSRIAAILDGRGHRLPAWRDTPPECCDAQTRRYGKLLAGFGSAM
jgi:hypothetical protein